MKVLVPLDGSALAEEALDAAEPMAKDGRMSLVHAVMPTEWFAMPADAIIARERKQAAAHLDRLAETLRSRGVDVTTTVATGEPSKVIATTAKKERSDVIVMASHGRTGAREWAFGSVAERVLRRSKVPVIVVRGRTRVPFELRKILVPLDGSGREAAMMPTVRQLEARFKSEIVLLHVARKMKQALKRGTATGTDRVLVLSGDPAETILRVAKQESADLLALAVSPKTEGSYVMLGHVAEAVLRQIDRPVMVMRV